jgi:predicted N-acetyltransferase YhbS
MTPEPAGSPAGRESPAGTATIRPAAPADGAAIWELLREFADYERLSHLVSGDATRLAAHLAGEAWPKVEGFVAEEGGAMVGYALYFGMFSSFSTAPLVWLEDLYVRESHRRTRLGWRLMAAVARAAVERGSQRVDWAVLEWNSPAIAFYRKLGARRQSEWHVYQLESEALQALAALPDRQPAGG